MVDPDPRATATLRERLRWFPAVGLLSGALFTLWAAFLNVVSGGIALAQNGTTLGRAAAVYLTAGALAGVLVALAWPRGRVSIVRAALLGVLGAAPLYTLVLLDQGHHEPWVEQLSFVAVAAGIVGGITGISLWLDEHPRGTVAPWIDALRYPTRPIVMRVWLGAGMLATLAWFVGGRWAGKWPAVIALVLFVVPLGFATVVTVVALRPARRRQPPGAA